MQIKQWEDKNLAHFSYAIFSDCEKKVVFIDPARNPQPYLDFAKENNAIVLGIIETHPHADFISSHLELHQVTGAPVYTHSLAKATYKHKTFDDGESFEFGKIKLTSIHTPGHSPDGISILLEHKGSKKAIFSGDTLFIGDCGRPDLRESPRTQTNTRNALAKAMYHTLRNKFIPLNNNVVLYPAHGAGSLCGKGLTDANSSTMEQERQNNWSLQPMSEDAFVKELLTDQPFIPAYFSYNVDLNLKGAPGFKQSISKVKVGEPINDENDLTRLDKTLWIIDARQDDQYKKGHLPHSVNLMEGEKFETWLGSIIKPFEHFYLAGKDEEQLERLLERCAAIGYEPQIKEAFVINDCKLEEPTFSVDRFKQNKNDYTIVDVRNTSEVKKSKPFENSFSMPLAEVRQRANELPTDKPIVVHCAGGYRSAAGSSIIKSILNGKAKVFDMGDSINEFIEQ